MREEGVLVAGAQPGRKGAGCFKVSSEEKSRMADAAKAAARKQKAQQKQGLGKVSWMDIQIFFKYAFLQVASKASKKPTQVELLPRPIREKSATQPRLAWNRG